ncbi:hypothetical protein J2T02_002558 [Chitinophaga terrae (ex Kim and Jung 2007)]|uniref:hypothetical protein n=1 Tax=Chitinophaga terrae (ex Kim and Jung 2007) TaxID=408074 RepID=UPI002786F96D|nr:hypothetical protein [Chitinophaga terrae (ex Kim and Jung 2007)]MDQ0107439.1 hypothetical protein [Chitinophaga terrae (ex Kim and Jung 2007)]
MKFVFSVALMIPLFVYSQDKVECGSCLKDKIGQKKPLSKEQFNEAVRKDFNALIGNDEKSLKSALTTTFDENESSLTAKFLVSPKFLNKLGYRHSFSGVVKVGESSNIFELGNSNMPILNLSANYNFLPSKKWFYCKSAKFNKSLGNNYVYVWKEPSMSDTIKYYYHTGEIKAQSLDTIWTHKRYLWVTVGANYNNSKYNIYDKSLSFQNQVYDTTYSGFSGNIGANFYAYWNHTQYEWCTLRPYFVYATLNYQLKRGSNIGRFKKVDVHDNNYDTLNNMVREVSRKRSAFEGQYEEFTQHKASLEILWGLGKNVIWDIFGDGVFAKGDAPTYSYGFGFYFIVKGKEKEPIVNFGLFIKKEGDKNPFLGIKTSLPINVSQ